MKSISAKPKKRGRGRPATGRDPMMGVRIPPDERKAIEAWAARQEDKPSLSEAIRRLLNRALRASRTSKEAASAEWKQRRLDRWAVRVNDLAWRLRLENLLRAAVHGSGDSQIFDGLPTHRPFGEEYVREEARELFGIEWKDGKIVGPLADEEAAAATPHRPTKRNEAE